MTSSLPLRVVDTSPEFHVRLPDQLLTVASRNLLLPDIISFPVLWCINLDANNIIISKAQGAIHWQRV